MRQQDLYLAATSCKCLQKLSRESNWTPRNLALSDNPTMHPATFSLYLSMVGFQLVQLKRDYGSFRSIHVDLVLHTVRP